MGMNLSQYARHRKARGLPGQTRQAVKRAVESGRIDLEPDGTIDPDKADRAWAERTKGSSFSIPKRAKAAATSFQRAKADLERAKAELAQLEVAKARGQLLEREAVEQALADAFGAVKAGLLSWPARLSTKVAGLKRRDDCRRVLAAEVDRLLAELAESVGGIG